MTWKTRLMVRESTFTAVAFTVAVYSYYLVAIWGVQGQLVGGPLLDYLTSPFVHVELIMTGVLFGGLIGVVNRLAETPSVRRRPLIQVILFRTVLFLVGLAFVAGAVALLFATLIFPWEVLAALASEVKLRQLVSVALWMVTAVVAINFALEVARVVGPGNLWGLLIGRYRRPRIEERVFLFMDLKGSTTIAEEAGHQRYSELLQECFRDLTEVVLRYEAAVYQYVGDEVVLSWPSTPRAKGMSASVQAFFAYQKALELKRVDYEERFGTVPVFRGGIDLGSVTVSEVGDVKREIVYHGDALNTAARLLELCKTQNAGLVVSQLVGEAVERDPGVRSSSLGSVALRGKQQRVEAYGLQRAG